MFCSTCLWQILQYLPNGLNEMGGTRGRFCSTFVGVLELFYAQAPDVMRFCRMALTHPPHTPPTPLLFSRCSLLWGSWSSSTTKLLM